MFATITSPAIPLMQDNLDTEFIAPYRGERPLKERAFARMRYDDSGRPLPASVFDSAPFNRAAILVTGRNFGRGPNPDVAIAALKSIDLTCIIAISFAPLFADRAFHEGFVLISIDDLSAQLLTDEIADGDAVTVDLSAQTITTRHGDRFDFSLPLTARIKRLQPNWSLVYDEGHLLVATGGAA